MLNLFLDDLAKAIEKRIHRSAEHAFVGRDDPEMPFWYNEQTSKGILTASIDELTETNFYQEYSIQREKGDGRLDYWLEYGNQTKIQIIFEVKHSWARIYSDRITIYNHAINLFNDAKEQLHSMGQKAFYANYAIAMLIMPLFSRYKSDSDKPLKLSRKRIEILQDGIERRFKSTHPYESQILILPHEYNKIHIFKKNEHDAKDFFESYPGTCLIYYIKKITKN